MKDHSELWWLYWLLDSQPFQGSRGQPALTAASEGWDADRGVGLAPEVLWGLGGDRPEGGRPRCEGPLRCGYSPWERHTSRMKAEDAGL